MPDRIRFDRLSNKHFVIALGIPLVIAIVLGIFIVTGQTFPFFTNYDQVFRDAAENCAGHCNEPLTGIGIAIIIIFSGICIAGIFVLIEYWGKYFKSKEKEPTQKASDVVSKKGDRTIGKK